MNPDDILKLTVAEVLQLIARSADPASQTVDDADEHDDTEYDVFVDEVVPFLPAYDSDNVGWVRDNYRIEEAGEFLIYWDQEYIRANDAGDWELGGTVFDRSYSANLDDRRDKVLAQHGLRRIAYWDHPEEYRATTVAVALTAADRKRRFSIHR
jgi:hypothetical protein